MVNFGSCWRAPRKFAKCWQPGHLPQDWLELLSHNSKWCEVFCIGKIICCRFCWCTLMALSIYHMGVAQQNIRGKNLQHQLHLKHVISKLVPPNRLLQELIGCWISSMWYLSSNDNNGDESVDTWFWQDTDCNEDGLEWKGFQHEKIHVAEWNHFDVSVIFIRLYLTDRNYTPSGIIQCSEWFLANHVFKMTSAEGALLRNCLRLVEAIDFHI